MSLVDDLKSVNKQVCFWNWKLQTRNTVIRYHTENSRLFKYSDHLDDLVRKILPISNKINGVVVVNGLNGNATNGLNSVDSRL